jgi:hypothetical protein
MKNYFLLIAMLVNAFLVSAQEKAAMSKTDITKIQKVAKQPIKKDTAITVRLTRSKLDYFKKNNIDPGTKASELLENYSVPLADIAVMEMAPPKYTIAATADTAVKNSQKEIVRNRIIKDGGFEISYSDSSKYIMYKDRFVRISPQGTTTMALMSQVTEYVPPADPTDPDLLLYLNNTNDKLLTILSQLLNNDASSISNYKQGEANLGLLGKINMRILFINFCTNLPK